MIDDIMPDRVIFVHHGGDHQFGAYAVDAGDHDRIFPFCKVNLEESTETADGSKHFRTLCRGEFRFEALQKIRCQIDIYSGALVGRVPVSAAVCHTLLHCD